ncbi:hypothetical protein MCOR14_001859 [Pyricularia oryzae]|nr:hypothetical protein MCOR34_002094 [Pyricularia oryzae]KAI6446826.1 hypothetical protein MCOR15_010395 [Pyricularia oryzae]KAI6518728.1 hypothetical protein MCOR16_008873 [Pyricularia oryzae]KAI6580305.1 hypothetical protein MCOR04_005749 [Pyricularia oryzae]KAI6643723.1 hypothetical protein MCOR14_001859 [Pyricularia oryzae]
MGDVYTIACDRVRLEFIGLDRFTPTPCSQGPAEEDAFCDKRRMLGASRL